MIDSYNSGGVGKEGGGLGAPGILSQMIFFVTI